MDVKLIDTLSMPAYALSYLVNGDASGLEDEDIATVDKWLKEFQERNLMSALLFDSGDEPYFTGSPEFGLPCDCVNCDVYGHAQRGG